MFTEYGKEYTDEQILFRAWDREVMQDMVGRFVYYWGSGDLEKAIRDLWVKELDHQKDASFATNIGFFVGIDEVHRHLVDEYAQREQETLDEFIKACPEKGYTKADLGMGMTRTHSCTTPLIYIANDGKTARYLGYDLGMSGKGKPDGSADCYFEVGLLFVEFVKEEEGWKIWHMVEEHDFSMEAGKDYNTVPTKITDPNDPSFKDFGKPTIEKEVYDNLYGWEYLFYDMPKPYKFYDEDEGYGAKGKIGRKFYERMI